jgi:hypothetical protein
MPIRLIAPLTSTTPLGRFFQVTAPKPPYDFGFMSMPGTLAQYQLKDPVAASRTIA